MINNNDKEILAKWLDTKIGKNGDGPKKTTNASNDRERCNHLLWLLNKIIANPADPMNEPGLAFVAGALWGMELIILDELETNVL